MGLKLFFPHANFELHAYPLAVIGVVNESQLRIRTNDHINMFSSVYRYTSWGKRSINIVASGNYNCMYIGLGVGVLVDLYCTEIYLSPFRTVPNSFGSL